MFKFTYNVCRIVTEFVVSCNMFLCSTVYAVCSTIVGMADRLLDDRDEHHRARRWEDGERDLAVVRTRTPRTAWRIHPSWVHR